MTFDLVPIEQLDLRVIDGDRGKNYPHQDELFNDGDCLFLSAKNVTVSGFDFTDNQFITTEKDSLLHNGKLSRNDIVITTRGTVGNVAYYSNSIPYSSIRINSGMLIVRCGKDVSSRYIYYVLSSPWFKQQIKKIQTGSAQPQLPKSHFLKMMLPIPPLEIQQKIESTLQAIDNRIIVNRQINDNLEQQALAVYASLFNPHTDSDVTLGTLKDIAKITMGQSPSGSSYNENGIGEVFYQGRAEFGTRFPNRRLYTTEPKRMAEAGDILLSVRAPVGDLNVAYERCCIGRGLGTIHSKSGHSSFILYTMISLRPQLDVFNGEGTVFGSINRNALNNLPIQIPAQATIDEFERIVRPMDDLIRTNHEENCRLQALRDSLLPRLMSGEIDVSSITL